MENKIWVFDEYLANLQSDVKNKNKIKSELISTDFKLQKRSSTEKDSIFIPNIHTYRNKSWDTHI